MQHEPGSQEKSMCSLTSSFGEPEAVRDAGEYPGIDAVDGQDGLGGRPRAHQRLVVEHPEVVPEPHDGHSTAASTPQTWRGVPPEGLIGRRGGLVRAQGRHRHRRCAVQGARRARTRARVVAHSEEDAEVGG